MRARFGTAGNPDGFYQAGRKQSKDMPPWLREQGLEAYEYQCGKGVTVGEATARAIGRAAAMDVSLADDDTVSRESHALVTYDAKHNSFSLSPGQGRGITYCNEEQVEMVRPLNAYDVIEVGKSQLIFLPLCGEKFQWNEE